MKKSYKTKGNKLKLKLMGLLLILTLSLGRYAWKHYVTRRNNEPKIKAVAKMKKVDSSKSDDTTTSSSENKPASNQGVTTLNPDELPKFDGSTPFVTVNSNVPAFTDEEKRSKDSFEHYSELDHLGRVGVSFANLSRDTMPKAGEKRGSIANVRPSGWGTYRFKFVDGGYLYNRSHMIGWQLSAENDNELNLATGTRFFNVDGMLPFENMVADYIKETGNHVLYRVTPIFVGDELVMRGLQMEGFSVEDYGNGISYNVYVYNAQPGVFIDYLTGIGVSE